MIDDDNIDPRRRPSAVISYSAIFSGVSLSGDIVVSPDVRDLMNSFHKKGLYILVESHADLYLTSIRLSTHNLPFNGLTHIKTSATSCSTEAFTQRVESHIGLCSVEAVVHEDIGILDAISKLGIVAYQIMLGSLINQSSSGRTRSIPRGQRFIYKAEATYGY